jgi:hypothetical protein
MDGKEGRFGSRIPFRNQTDDHIDLNQSKMSKLFRKVVYALFVIHAGIGFLIAQEVSLAEQDALARRGVQMSSCCAQAA